MDNASDIFKKGSRTYFTSSLLFPAHVRKEVTDLYAFVRTADNFVDARPQDMQSFSRFKNAWRAASTNVSVANPIVESYANLTRKYAFPKEWTDAFLDSMEADYRTSSYETMDELLRYVYGSAEVIGLMMAKIIGAPEAAFESAKKLGRAFQYVNILRDIKEDRDDLGRTYIPRQILLSHSLPSLSQSDIDTNREAFSSMMRAEIARYRDWCQDASEGIGEIPRDSRKAVIVAASMYDWTAREIEKDPFAVFEKKIKPSKARILFTALTKRI